MARMEYTEEQRNAAIASYVEFGPIESSRLHDIPAGTITSWASRSGAAAERKQKMEEAREALSEHIAMKRDELHRLLIEKTVDLMERMDRSTTMVKVTNDGTVVEYEKRPGSDDVKNLATAVGILIDKFRLEAGEVTTRGELVGADLLERARERGLRLVESA